MAMSILALTTFAGEWVTDSYGRWYNNGNGTYPKATWQWIDENNDGIAECYYFDEDGYNLRCTTTPDGYYVNSSGAWVKDDVVQTKTVDDKESAQIKDNSEINRKVLEEYKHMLYKDPDLLPYAGTNRELYFGVIDVDRDGIYELNLYTPGNCNANMNGFLLYYNEVSQSVKKVEKFYNPLYILPNNQFFTFYSHMGLDFHVFSKVNGDWIKTESLFGYQSIKDVDDNMKIEAYSNVATGRDDMVELTQSNITKYLSGDGISTESNDVNELKELIVLLYEHFYEYFS